MSKLIRQHLPCSTCGSSDALAEYSDGTYCFSCGTSNSTCPFEEHTTNKINLLTGTQDYDILSYSKNTLSTLGLSTKDNINYISIYNIKDNNTKDNSLTEGIYNYMDIENYRNIDKKTLVFYKVLKVQGPKGTYLKYPYSTLGGFKVRCVEQKEFFSEGNMKGAGLYGRELFDPHGKAITITEGENDAMAVWQMNGGYPAVSVKGATSAMADVKAEYDFINSFDRVYLAFDNDEPGQKALREVASLFNPNKVYHVKLDKHKDPHAYLEAGEIVLFNKTWWAAKPYLPAGIVGDYDSIEEILNQESAKPVATYPYKKLQDMTYGIRLGEVNLLTALEKIGKTEVLRSIEYHLLKTTDYNIGIIHLEESEKRTIQGLVGYELKKPVHLPDSNVANIETLNVFKNLTKRDSRCFLYKHFGSDDPKVILDTIRYLVAVCDCKFIFLDHITMLVTGFQSDDERKTLDYLSTQLAMLTRELNFTLFLVSHVNDDGKTRGSRNISKIADLIIHLDRDIEAATIDQRNTTNLLVKGNRWAGLSGPSSSLFFDQGTFTLQEVTIPEDRDTMEIEKETAEESQGSDYRPTSLWAKASSGDTSGGISDRETDAGLRPADNAVGSETLGLTGMVPEGSVHDRIPRNGDLS